MRRIFVTGTAGFIGYHLATDLLRHGYAVTGYDGMTDYYDVSLKRARHAKLSAFANFSATEAMLEDTGALMDATAAANPDAIVHLAAQAGVRYSLEHPRTYVDTNLTGTFNVMECARELGVPHLLMASTSSVYGGNKVMPFAETQSTDAPLTLYAATKKANEAMAHSYAHLWNLPTTMLRFFSVYGPWGRPDLALFKFVAAAYSGQPIDVYNRGNMSRDFTYVTDLARAIRLLIDAPPSAPDKPSAAIANDSLSSVAPFRTVNIGNGKSVSLMRFIDEIEAALDMPIKKNLLGMQLGDVPDTWADTTLLQALTGFAPQTEVADGIAAFVAWYRDHYQPQASAVPA